MKLPNGVGKLPMVTEHPVFPDYKTVTVSTQPENLIQSENVVGKW